MARVLLAVLALVALMWFFSYIGRLDGPERARYLRRAGVYGVVGIIIAMVLTGRAPAIFALVAGIIPLMQRAMLLRSLAGMLSRMGIRIPGIDRLDDLGAMLRGGVRESRYLRLSRDQASGRVAGAVMNGRFAGRKLDDMALNDLFTLLHEIRSDDPDGEALLVAYLDATFDGWRDQYSGGENAQKLSRAEAFEVLGLEPGADRDTIIKAHRQLMGRVHPDRGGVDWMATKLNQARDVLLEDDTV